MDDFTGKQLGALTAVALAAPVVHACGGVSWPFLLMAVGIAGLYYIYIGWAAGRLPAHLGLARLTLQVYGSAGGKLLLGLYWLWLALAAARAGRLAGESFALAEGFPAVAIAVVIFGAWLAAKGPAAVCRFGSVLFFFLFALLAVILAFAAGDMEAVNLKPFGTGQSMWGPLTVFLLPAAGLLLRDAVTGKRRYGRWFFLVAALAVGSSLVTVGTLGPALATQVRLPFYYMSKSISILGVMERFESVVSALLLTGFAALLAYLFTLAGKIAAVFAPGTPLWAVCALSAAAALALLWAVPLAESPFWWVGDGLFWGLLPMLTLGVANVKKMQIHG